MGRLEKFTSEVVELRKIKIKAGNIGKIEGNPKTKQPYN